MKLIILSNRLPVKIEKDESGEFIVTPSEGGLATGLGSLETEAQKIWIGWPGIYTDDEEERKEITERLNELDFYPVFLTNDHLEKYYEGYSNSTIWPLCHYFFSYIDYKTEYWDAYQEVNKLFRDVAIPLINDEDIIWVQDYQLMLLPALIREKKSEVSIGYFHHIPFPSYELFRVLPKREVVLNGLLGADLIGFHTHDYMRHFISAIYRVLQLESKLDEIQLSDRMVHVDTFPMGINYDHYHDAVLEPKVKEYVKEIRKNIGDESIILSVDRLDYSKGILHRLHGFSQFLENHPEYLGKVSLAMIVVPSRDQVDMYADLKIKIDETIGKLNGKYSELGWTPVHYFYRSFEFEELIAMYHTADIALVSPLRDGMNLVAKEYIATKHSNPGVLILSEMAGAAIELPDAIIINPNDAEEIEKSILQALTMDEDEKMKRMKKMQKRISTQTVKKWASDFVGELQTIKTQNIDINKKVITQNKLNIIKKKYDKAKKRLLVLDYDGTLSTFVKNPEDATPTERTLQLLKNMVSDKRNKVVINSGRNHEVLDKWFEGINLDLAAEHGAFYKIDGKWHQNMKEKPVWDEEILDIIQRTIDKTPRSELEIKNTALVWHYRNSDIWLAEMREKQLVNQLIGPVSRHNLQIMRGNKIVEIKSPDYNKGSELKRLLEKEDYDFVLAIGDDTTDDDMFLALPEGGISIKVGDFSEAAEFRLPWQSEVVPFLEGLIE
ncbi:MAG: bifunctional alpha,alpha-trehalose-phosphate synthase (UDP-forming)/trehalose-phosphatase [Dysgonamonadaceae bacterium]|nr:bifunctional alpha,alpha-trehalose-phosphate synthase (UDP-forming)/trehalose-phosphatase [Dysgonamonadaceae bacterium]MDD3356045.1 bifunctional alpha,alpha-trehalose-phosphate synthase (UDP-forming)/trehalose-phosphatase [Dysgonamonadaceae bacterium]MDD3727508.1 bifunctional alpha,alpha-trehalose-phosphate synthase (UDP-forming)/trehalose-phosphatase [Dysgonamonadaceae bacterium]MDD4246228.1 bifunctional alpha,alpha-trehalose-phosphate synthase (UDP-forming)/trehalose-phosphatase [Dysgonamon